MRRAETSKRFAAAAVAIGMTVLAGCGSRLDRQTLSETTTIPGTQPVAPATTSSGQPSETGVTGTEIHLGLIVSKTSPLGSETFAGPMYGALAYFSSLNDRGGINGRTIRLTVCDDNATGAGNRRCARQLIEDDKVMAFVGNSIFDYAAASYVNDKGVPDVGGQPIDTAYEQYRHLFNIYGTSSPRDGVVGVDGKLDGGTEVYRYFKQALGAGTAGVVYYNQGDSQRFADLTAIALEVEGYTVVREQVDFSVPNFDAAAIDMRSRGVDIVFDAMDSAGNVRLCEAMDGARLSVKAKVVTVQSWNESVRTQYAKGSTCRNSIYATATTRNYMDLQFPAVSQFRDDMRRYYPDREDKLSMWTLEGWAAAQWFTDAASSCGAALTRVCVEAYLERPEPYDGHGLLVARDFVPRPQVGGSAHNCLSVARWQDDAFGGTGGWVTTTPNGDFICYDVPDVVYTP
ncbi:MAG TPA: ABC transporter substrate-binding protein [Ilumatobacteraceae bacterium]|nr:ABC transporter substrate-binding protein [Ilumatobacteraceae bacterium]